LLVEVGSTSGELVDEVPPPFPPVSLLVDAENPGMLMTAESPIETEVEETPVVVGVAESPAPLPDEASLPEPSVDEVGAAVEDEPPPPGVAVEEVPPSPEAAVEEVLSSPGPAVEEALAPELPGDDESLLEGVAVDELPSGDSLAEVLLPGAPVDELGPGGSVVVTVPGSPGGELLLLLVTPVDEPVLEFSVEEGPKVMVGEPPAVLLVEEEPSLDTPVLERSLLVGATVDETPEELLVVVDVAPLDRPVDDGG